MKKQFKMFIYFLIMLTCMHYSVSAERQSRGVYLSQSAGASLNQLGLLFTTDIYYHLPLLTKDGILWESTRLNLGINNEFAPAFEAPGVFLRIEPIAFFELNLRFNNYLAYKTLGFGYIPYNSYSIEFDSDDIEKRENTQRTVDGWWLRVNPVLKLKFKNLIFADAFTIHRFMMLEKGYFFERFNNVIINTNDNVIVNNTYLLYQINKKFTTGINYTYQSVPASDFDYNRLCLMGIFNWKRLTTVIMGGSYLDHAFYGFDRPYVALSVKYESKICRCKN
jgi:hypothetical protein